MLRIEISHILLVVLVSIAPDSLAGTRSARPVSVIKKCAVTTCKNAFESAISRLSTDNSTWTKQVEAIRKAHGFSACLEEVDDIAHSGSPGIPGCQDCTYGEMSSSISSKIEIFNESDETSAEETEETKSSTPVNSDQKFSKNENLTIVFSKIRADALTDLKEGCRGPSIKTVKKIPPTEKLKRKSNGNSAAAY